MVRRASEKRLETARRAYDALIAGDLEAVMAGATEEIEWRNPKQAVEGGTRKGRASFAVALERLTEMFEYERFEIEGSAEHGDAIAIRVHFVGRGRGSGAPIDSVFGHVFRFDHGRLVAFEWFPDPAAALEAVGAERWPGEPTDGS